MGGSGWRGSPLGLNLIFGTWVCVGECIRKGIQYTLYAFLVENRDPPIRVSATRSFRCRSRQLPTGVDVGRLPEAVGQLHPGSCT